MQCLGWRLPLWGHELLQSVSARILSPASMCRRFDLQREQVLTNFQLWQLESEHKTYSHIPHFVWGQIRASCLLDSILPCRSGIKQCSASCMSFGTWSWSTLSSRTRLPDSRGGVLTWLRAQKSASSGLLTAEMSFFTIAWRVAILSWASSFGASVLESVFCTFPCNTGYWMRENYCNAIAGWCRANTGEELTKDILPALQELGAKTTDVMVVNFAIWSNRYILGRYKEAFLWSKKWSNGSTSPPHLRCLATLI